MARFDVYAHPDPAERAAVPFLLDVQSSYLESLATRVVVPLFDSARFDVRVRNLNPCLEVTGQSVVMDTASIAAIALSELRRPIANLTGRQLEIQDALDTLFGSY